MTHNLQDRVALITGGGSGIGAATARLLAERGAKVFVTDRAGAEAVAEEIGGAFAVYSATKHGLVGFTKSLALAHAHEGLRVNAVCPGPIDTPMFWGNFEDVPRDEAAHRALATCPDPRIASPVEVAEAVAFLASDAARFINGVALPIDGAKAAGVMPAHRYRLDFELTE